MANFRWSDFKGSEGPEKKTETNKKKRRNKDK